jgi:catechol 1,2-dioxygenase
VRVDAEGRYEVRSVVPVPSEIPPDGPVGTFLRSFGRHAWRPAHLHVRALAPGHRALTTMLYLAEDPWLADDAIGSVKDSLVLGLERGEDGVARGRYDFVLAAA